jgi:sec-independent protein translocase protein TatA
VGRATAAPGTQTPSEAPHRLGRSATGSGGRPLIRVAPKDPAMLFPFGFLFGPPGMMEMLILAAIILLLFGNRLPSVMRSMGRGIVEFKKGIKGIEDDIDEAGKIKDSGEIKGKVDREPFKE